MAIPVIQVGLGPIGQSIVRRLLGRADMAVVAAVDPAPDKAGRHLGEVLGLAPGSDRVARDVIVHRSLSNALAKAGARPQVAVHTTSSFLAQVTPQLGELAETGLNVVSTAEELSYPWWHHPAEAEKIDAAARRAGITVLGTGVNPGFVMDLLPVCLSGVTVSVEAVQVERVVDAGLRRGPLKRKIGAGITVEEFEQRKATGAFGHIGLVESVAMIAAAFGWELDAIESELRPKIAEVAYTSADLTVPPGRVLGIDQVAVGRERSGRERIRLHLEMYAGAPAAHDTIRLSGEPPLTLTIPGGTPGDIATAGVVINAISAVLAAPPGLTTMLDLPVPRWRGGVDRVQAEQRRTT